MSGVGVEAPSFNQVFAGLSPRKARAFDSSRWKTVVAGATGGSLMLVCARSRASSPAMRRGSGRVMAVDNPWPNGQACHGCGWCPILTVSGCRRRCPGCLRRHHPQHILASWPGRLARLVTFAATCRGSRLPLVTLADFPQSHCFQVKYSFPPMVIGPERAYGSSPSTTYRLYDRHCGEV
jgi:hypothetical protein